MLEQMLSTMYMKMRRRFEACRLRFRHENPVRRQNLRFDFSTDDLRHKQYFERGERSAWQINEQVALLSSEGYSLNDFEGCNHILLEGEEFTRKYTNIEQIAYGGFGRVYKVLRGAARLRVAKLFRNNENSRLAAEREYAIITEIADAARLGNRAMYFVKVYEMFELNNHPIIIYEYLPIELRSVMHVTNFNLNQIRLIMHNVLSALEFIASFRNPIIHGDVKPENIMLRYLHDHRRYCAVLIDFGLSRRVGEIFYGDIQTREYRAPEVLMNNIFDTKIDVWSMGVVGVELYIGWYMFLADSDIEQLQEICKLVKMRVASPPDMSVVEEPFLHSSRTVKRELFKYLGITAQNIKVNQSNEAIGIYIKDIMSFVNLLEKMLRFNPRKRVNAKQALRHPFFKKYQPL